MKGNVIDMAVGVIIGGAFGKIVSSLVDDIIMPVIGACTGGIDFKDYTWTIKAAVMKGNEIIEPAVTMNWGQFINYIVNFLIIAISIFVALRVVMKFKKKEEEAPAPAAEPTKEEQLLTEIRDLLAKEVKK